MSAARQKFLRAITSALTPDERITVDEWAKRNRVLPPDTPEPGPWRNERTPYLVDIMRTMSTGSPWREGWVKKGHQLGGSASGENFLGAAICTAAGSILVVFATLEDAKQWEQTRFEEMRRSTPELRRRVRDAGRAQSGNTKLRKKFPGGVMRLVGANRVGALKSSTIRYVKFEEPDEYAADLDDQGSPITLAIKRTSNYGNKAKVYGDGTPTIKDASAIDAQYKRGDQRQWRLFCPECGHPQPIEWKNIRADDGDPSTAKLYCIGCGVGNTESAWKTKNYARTPGMTEAEAAAAGLAHWVPTAQGEPGVASWHMPSFIAPIGWRPWTKLVAESVAAQGDEEKLKAFRNNEEGDVWAENIGTVLNAEALKARAENYPLLICPERGLVVVAGVDTQDNRLAVEVRAYGRGEESWGLHHGEIFGSPGDPGTWAKLRELLESRIPHASGQTIGIDACAIDMGGHHGEDVKAFCRAAALRGKHWFAIQGAREYDAIPLGKPRTVELNYRGKAVPGGVEVRYVGTQGIKNKLYGRLRDVATHGPGFLHFPLAYSDDYFKQVVGERRQWKKDTKGNRALWWMKLTNGTRNEGWDILVYGYAAFLFEMSGRNAEAVWLERERIFGLTAQADLALMAPSLSSLTVATPSAVPGVPHELINAFPTAPRPRGRRGSLASSYR